MAPRPRHRRFLVPVLAITLALEVSLVALAIGPATLAGPAQASGSGAQPEAVVGGPGGQAGEHPADRLTIFRGGAPYWLATGGAVPGVPSEAPSTPTPATVPNVAVASEPSKSEAGKPVPKPAAKPTRPAPAKVPPSYRGRNHVWIPTLGVNRSVSFYSCSRSTALANVVYRWGCGGRNNVYLMGHAWGVFRALHDAYYSGRLRKGMQVVYADASGHVTRYKVSFWKVVSPVGADWAYASQSRPSLTLQTCVGSSGQSRLVVRLVASG